ncbi:hypothetical protein NC653_006196 [Populus alba x Populus x berolinensis]|uniref:Branched-chain amino acid aminotransferase n=1 Tax=Populus alba x Populus x berolinensis TaxID=444605 RepID=A0AAD6RE32_9ROSI|nr:hypothetical protein NC653_006196 [Populus alba x Populus x berolinensis]
MIQTNSGLRSLVQSLRPITSSLSEIAAYSCYTSQAASALQQVSRPNSYSEDEYAKVDWDNLGFGITPVDYMYTMKCSSDGKFEQGQLAPYGNVDLSPSAAVLNYGQGLYEGTKAYRTEDGRLLLFRLDQNATRMKMGADRLCMACPSSYQFIDAVKQTALANKRWVTVLPLFLLCC